MRRITYSSIFASGPDQSSTLANLAENRIWPRNRIALCNTERIATFDNDNHPLWDTLLGAAQLSVGDTTSAAPFTKLLCPQFPSGFTDRATFAVDSPCMNRT